MNTHFPDTFKRSANPKKKLFLQDGDPSQNSKKACIAFDAIGCSVFEIPARSPDLNPIENIFNIVREQLKEEGETKQIRKESFADFSMRIKQRIEQFPMDIINKTIGTMMKRMELVKKGKGHRTKY